MDREDMRFARRALTVALIVGLIIAFAYAIDLVLLAFAGILLAVLFRSTGVWLHHHTNLSMKWSMAIVLAGCAALLGWAVWIFGVRIVEQADALYSAVDQAMEQFSRQLQHYRIGQRVLSDLSIMSLRAFASDIASFGIYGAGGIVLVLFIGAYVSIEPDLYKRAFLTLFSQDHRRRLNNLFDEIGVALRWWLLGQFIAMSVVGIITTAGLLIVGAPMAIALGVLAMLLTFVPYVGPIVSAIPAVLIALTQGTHMAAAVLSVYVIAHGIEGYVVEPQIQHRLVLLPPAMILVMQFLLEVFAGVPGVMFATPLMVVAMVATKRLYFDEDWQTTGEKR
jgi:predicted PurR-regulated permease PerM